MNIYSLFFGSLLLLLCACNPYKKDTSGVDQRKRLEEYRKSREKEISVEGRWQEYKRTIVENRMAPRVLNFMDTIKVLFDGMNNTKLYDAQGRITGGQFIKEATNYRIGNGISYDGFSVSKGEMVLRNGNQTSYLKLVDRFYIAQANKQTVGTEQQEIVKLDASFLIGKWSVYKKEHLNTSRPAIYLDALEIGNAIDATSYNLLSFISENSKVKRSEGILRVKANQLITETSNGLSSYKILKAGGNELIIQDEAVTYFLKDFSKG